MKNNLFIFLAGWGSVLYAQNVQKNILFICVDDLNTEIGLFPESQALTPNINQLARDGMLFRQHYVAVPTSGASRASMLTSMYPRTENDLSNEACKMRMSRKPEQETPESLFHALRRAGYYTIGIGKISHYADGYVYGYNDPKSDVLEMPHSWNEMLFCSSMWGTGWHAYFGYADGTSRQSRKNMVKPYECASVDDNGYVDGLSADLAVKKIKECAVRKQPFCLAVGFIKPHLPFNAPEKYWNMYERDSIRLTSMPDIPENAHKSSLHGSEEFKQYRNSDEFPSLDHNMSDEYSRKLRHAYLACVSYADAQIGKVIQELKNQQLYDNTIIVLWGDNGWHLGDMRVWGKHTLFEASLHTPLIFRVPGVTDGSENNHVVSSVDIYPTLLDLCNVEIKHQIDGRSMVELLKNPENTSWEDVAYSYYRGGISMRVPKYRLTYYVKNTDHPKVELYDLTDDGCEKENIALHADSLLKELTSKWSGGNTGLYGAISVSAKPDAVHVKNNR